MKYFILVYISILFILSSCQTAPVKKYDASKLVSAEYKGFVSVKDKKKGKSYLVSYKSKLYKYDFLRLDVTAPFIGHLASLSVLKDKIQYVIPAKNKYYSGPLNSKHLKEILPFELESKILFNLFWGSEIKQPGWKCKLIDRLPQVCVMAEQKIKVSWERKSGVPSKMSVTHPFAFVEFFVKDFIPNPKNLNAKSFIINKPNF